MSRRPPPPLPPAGPRCGYTLIELLTASAAATVLVGGMAQALLVAGETARLQAGAASGRAGLADAVTQMTNDLRHATSFSERTATSVTFAVPDRDGDGAQETIRYFLDGPQGSAAAELRVQYNPPPGSGDEGDAGESFLLVSGVQQFAFDYVERDMPADPPEGSRGVRYEGFSEAGASPAAYSVAVDAPPDTEELDLLIAAVALHGDGSYALAAAGDWTPLMMVEHPGRQVTLGVWWKLAGAAEPASYSFSWGRSEQAYAWVMRFTGHDVAAPINSSDGMHDEGDEVGIPAIDTTVDNALVLHLGAFHSDGITTDEPGLDGCVAITMDGVNDVSGGGGYRFQDAAGKTPEAAFLLTGAEPACTVTIAVAPQP